MLTGIHFLLTYKCPYECDHCFVYGGPYAKGTMTVKQLRTAMDEMHKIETIRSVCFEGGEPTMFHPLLLEGVRMANAEGYEVGIVTNAFFAVTEEDAALWLAPLKELKLSNIAISDDPLHSNNKPSPAQNARNAARKMGIECGILRTEPPIASAEKDAPIGGGVMFRGRAADKLVKGLPMRHWKTFTTCPYENLSEPSRLHIDAYGNAHICQGVCMGNIWDTPLSELVKDYESASHPITGPLVKGGPAELATEYNVPHEDEYVDACQLCFRTRQALLDRFPNLLAPRQVYGLG